MQTKNTLIQAKLFLDKQKQKHNISALPVVELRYLEDRYLFNNFKLEGKVCFKQHRRRKTIIYLLEFEK